MVTTGLAVNLAGDEYLPKIRAVHSTSTVDQLRARMLPGQTREDWATAATRLAQTQPVPAFPTSTSVDLSAPAVARREDGLTYRLRLLGTHLLVVGPTGSGRGSVLWSIIGR